jgi:L-asparaginase
MNKIAIIYMGGTFGCVGSPLAPMPADEFIGKLQALSPSLTTAQCAYFAAPCIKDSSELHAADWLELSAFILDLRAEFQRFILIHGTDSLSYAGAMLHHVFATDLQLIITGSQSPLLEPHGRHLNTDSDAWDNLSFALEQTAKLDAGVYIAFQQQIFAANSCYKLHTQQQLAFLGQQPNRSLALPPSLHFIRQLTPAHQQAAAQIQLSNLYLNPSSSTSLAQNLAHYAQHPPHILILQAFGAGNLPYSEAVAQQLKQLIAQGCWVILSTQVLYGPLSQQYATGAWLQQTGVVFDVHSSQADTYARAILLYLQHGHAAQWQSFWSA